MNFLRHVHRFFSPPVFPNDDEKTRQARVLYVLVMNLGAVLFFAIIIGNIFIFTEKFYTTLVLALTLLIVISAAGLMHKGHVWAGSMLVVVMFWVITTGLAYISGGMRSYHASLYLSGTVIAGLLLGLPGSLIFGTTALGTGLIMTLMGNAGYKFPALFPYPTASLWIILFINVVAILLPLSITLRSLAEALSRARRHADEMALLYQLGLSVAGGKDLYTTLNAIQTQLMQLIQVDAFYVALYNEESDIVRYPIFFSEGRPMIDNARHLKENPGLTGAVIFNRKTLYLPDILTDEIKRNYRPVDTNDLVLHTFLGVPLIIEDRVLGMLSVQSKAIDAYNSEQVKLVEAIAAQAVVAIDKAHLLEQLQSELIERKLAELATREERDQLERRRLNMEKVIELGKAVAQETDLRACLHTSHQAIQKGLGFDRVGLFLYDSKTDTIHGTFGTNRRGAIEDSFWFTQRASEHEAWTKALDDPNGVMFIENYQDQRQFDPSSEMYNVNQHVTLAAWAGDTPVALIAADNVITQRPITSENVEALRLLAGYIGLSIKNAALNDDLEQRVHERTAQLEAAISELDSFSFSVAHDLRAPLRGMRGFSQIVLEENSAILDERAHNHLQRISASAKQMGELIDALLDFSRLTRVALNREEVNLSVLSYDIMSGLKRSNAKRKIHFEVTDGIIASADKRLIRIVLEHLLNNAWKFTSKKERATVAFGSAIINNERVFLVRDDGAGFNMAYSGKLFGAFQRLHRPDEFPGHGAGLAIVQRIIKKHGGRIWAEGAVDNGATFYFTLG